MRKVVGLVVVLAVLVLGGYYAMGVATERTIRKNLTAINKSSGLLVEINQYDRGWFKSKALLTWRVHVPPRDIKNAAGQTQTLPPQDYTFQMPLNIYHGPIIFHKGVHFGLGYGRTTLSLPPEYSQKFKQVFTDSSTEPKLKLALFVNYLAQSKFDMDVPAFKVTARDDNAQYEWLGLSSDMKISSSGDKITGDVDIQGMRFTDATATAVIDKIDTEYNFHKTETGLFLGDVSFSFPSISIKNANNNNNLDINAFTLSSSSDIENGLFSSHFQTSVDKITANNKVFGPGNFEAAIRNLDAVVLTNITNQINQMQQGTDLEKQQVVLAMLPEIPKLFSKGAEFEIPDMSLVMPQGKVEGNLIISLPAGEFKSPFELMQRLTGNGMLKLPAEVLNQILTASNQQKLVNQTDQQALALQIQQQASGIAPQQNPTLDPAAVNQQAAALTNQQLNAMLQSGLIVQQGDHYVINFALDQGRLTVNDKAFNPAMLKF